ncbi:MAG: ATP-binding protein [Candidatus Wallbacteria bacterium]|nr:ATP-binding protein [Candidatus Wallbacteria bacterium]
MHRNIARKIQKQAAESLFQGKVLVIYGARQTGKTTLARMIMKKQADTLYLNCDEIDVRQGLSGRTSTELAAMVRGYRLVVIDEAQRVENIGLTLKLFADNLLEVQVIATGSSAFELSDRIKESLAGRAIEFHLHPFSMEELLQIQSRLELSRLLQTRMIFGMYPEVVLSGDKGLLGRLADSTLYKDVMAYQGIRNHDAVLRLLQALALQIGSEVSYNELGSMVGIDKKTVENYLSILEKAFVIFRLPPFSRNLRNELRKLRKIYFWDTGIRNALINNFNALNLRSDKGALFENFVISERMKRNSNLGVRKNCFFWRTHQQKEIDYIEEEGGVLHGYEMKFTGKKYKPPKEFLDSYPGSTVELISIETCLEFLL